MGTVFKNFEVARNLKVASQYEVVSVSISSGEITINPNISRYFVVVVNENITTININSPKGCLQFLILFQFSGSYTVTGFPVTVSWIGSNIPASGVSGEEILASFTYWGSSIGYRSDSSPNYTP